MSKHPLLVLAALLGFVVSALPVFAQELKALEEGAKKEGKINLYGSIRDDEAQPIIDAFEKKYPGVKLDYFRSSEDKLVSRILTAAKA